MDPVLVCAAWAARSMPIRVRVRVRWPVAQVYAPWSLCPGPSAALIGMRVAVTKSVAASDDNSEAGKQQVPLAI